MFDLITKVDNQYALDLDGKPYTTLGYTNGPGGLNGTRPDITNVDTTDKNYRQQATVLLRSETHGSEDVGKPVVGKFSIDFSKKRKGKRGHTDAEILFFETFSRFREHEL